MQELSFSVKYEVGGPYFQQGNIPGYKYIGIWEWLLNNNGTINLV